MLEHLKNTCAHSVTFTQRSVEQHTVFAASRRGGSRLHVPRTERSSGGLFNFLVGAAFHSRARFRPSLSFFFFSSKIRRNSCSPRRSFRRGRPLSLREKLTHVFALLLPFLFISLPFLFFFHVSSFFFSHFGIFCTYMNLPMSHDESYGRTLFSKLEFKLNIARRDSYDGRNFPCSLWPFPFHVFIKFVTLICLSVDNFISLFFLFVYFYSKLETFLYEFFLRDIL